MTRPLLVGGRAPFVGDEPVQQHLELEVLQAAVGEHRAHGGVADGVSDLQEVGVSDADAGEPGLGRGLDALAEGVRAAVVVGSGGGVS